MLTRRKYFHNTEVALACLMQLMFSFLFVKQLNFAGSRFQYECQSKKCFAINITNTKINSSLWKLSKILFCSMRLDRYNFKAFPLDENLPQNSRQVGRIIQNSTQCQMSVFAVNGVCSTAWLLWQKQ
jgi:hypothetical protein